MFTDEVDKGRLNEAVQKCGSNASKACIADYLATGDISLAKVSGEKEHDSKSDIETIGMRQCLSYCEKRVFMKNHSHRKW